MMGKIAAMTVGATIKEGAKMSKSKGNVINPIEIVNEFGADALRISLVAGSTPGNPIALSKEKVKGYRNFGNKLWNIGRYILLQHEAGTKIIALPKKLDKEHATILKSLSSTVKYITSALEKYRFSDAALRLHGFVWDECANTYLEKTKSNSTYLPCFRIKTLSL